MSSFPYRRIVIIGTTSSGKSTLAEAVAKRLDLVYVDLDALHWEPNWQGAPLEVFRARVIDATQTGRWVVAGNYHSVRDLLWPQAEVAIWLDYPFPVIFRRLWRRTWRRWWQQELLWGTNRESIWTHFKLWSDDSLFKWLFKTYWRRKREFPQLLALPEHRHLQLIHFKDPDETDEWLAGFNVITE
jgi:adenylate kinase family enzyme